MLEPSRQIAIVKKYIADQLIDCSDRCIFSPCIRALLFPRLPSFRMSKRVRSLVSDAIQCLTLIPRGGDMTTGVDNVRHHHCQVFFFSPRRSFFVATGLGVGRVLGRLVVDF